MKCLILLRAHAPHAQWPCSLSYSIKKGSNYFSDNYDITLTTAKIDLPIINEEEPNQDFSQSMSIDEKTIIRSFLDNSSDIDTFSFIPSQAGYLFLTFDTANDYINNTYFLRLFSEDSNGFRTLVKAVSVGQDYKFSTRVTDQKKYYLNVQADSEQNFTSDIYEINYKINQSKWREHLRSKLCKSMRFILVKIEE